jgi:sialic acid synthase SpsE
VAETGKFLIISQNITNIDQIRKSKRHIENILEAKGFIQHLAIHHCGRNYPASPLKQS